MIIKGLFGNKDDGDKNERKASASLKFCGICQEAFKRGTDDVRLAHCNDCNSNERHLNASHWKQVFLQKKANSLSPDMARLADKLASNRALIEGKKMTRAAGEESDRTERNLGEIRKAQSSLDQVDFGVVKAQVAEMLPSILNELGLSKKVNASLLVDLIVPIKISSPISNAQAGRSALKTIVHEALEHLDINREMKRESAVTPHGTVASVDTNAPTLSEGFGRVSHDYGNRSRLIEQVAADMQMPLEEEAPSAFALANGADGMTDSSSESGPSADVAHSEGMENSGVTKLDDAQADAMINGQPPEATPEQMPEDPMLNEGVGTYSGGDNYVPDASEMNDMPQEGVKRVDQAGPDFASRQVANLKTQKAEKAKMEIFSFVGKVSAQLPVQSVRLSTVDRTVIENHPPINHMSAVFSDRSKLAWNYYLTDSGFLMVSAENTFHAKSLEAFADFVESDSTFAKWASLPEELQIEAPPALNAEHEVDEMAMPMAQPAVPGGEGTLGFNEIPETVLEPSPDNAMGGGMMNEQEAIFDNSGDTTNPADVQTTDNAVLDTASEMLPHIEKMFPEAGPEEHEEMAITAALDLMSKKTVIAGDLGKAIVNTIGNGAKTLIDKAVGKLPSSAQPVAQKAVDSVKPHMGVAKPSNGSGGYAPLADMEHALPNALKASLIANKAASLMPFINDNYATETRETKLAIALEAAYNFLKTAEPAVMDAPPAPAAATPAPVAPKKAPGGGGAKQQVGPEQIFDKVHPDAWHGMVQSMSADHPEVGAIAHDKDQSLELAKSMAHGHYPGEFFGGNTSPSGPKFTAPKSTFDRLPANREKAHAKLVSDFDAFAGKAKGFAGKLRNSGGVPVDNPDNDHKPATPETKAKWDSTPSQDILGLDNAKEFTNDNGNGAIPTNKQSVPPDKQRNIDQLVNQLSNPKAAEFDEEGNPVNEGQDSSSLMEGLHGMTPHLSDEQRKKMLPQHLHATHDDVAKGINQRDRDTRGTTRDLGNASEGLDDAATNLENSTSKSQIAPKRNQTNDENLFQKRPVNSEEAEELPSKEERNKNRKELRNDSPLGRLGDEYKKKRNDDLADKIQNDDRYASKANELRSITAGLGQAEFELVVDALLDMGYSEHTIMAEAERRFSK